MRSIATTYKSNTESAGVMTIKIMARRNLIAQLRCLVKSTDWDKNILAAEKLLNKICLVFVGLISVLILR